MIALSLEKFKNSTYSVYDKFGGTPVQINYLDKCIQPRYIIFKIILII